MSDPTIYRKSFEKRGKEIFLSAAMPPDGSAAFAGASDGKVYRFDAADEKSDRVALDGAGHTSYVTGVALAGDRLVSVGYDKRLVFWNVADGKQVRSIDLAHENWIRRVVAYPDGSRVVTVGDDMHVAVWDAGSGERLARFGDHEELTPQHYPSMLFAAAVSPDGTRIATADKVGHVALWNAETFEQIGAVEAPTFYTWDPKARVHSIGGVRSLAFSPDNSRLAVGGIGTIGNVDHLDGKTRVELFDLGKPSEPSRVIEDDKKKGLVERLVWAADGSWLLAAGGSGNGFLTFFAPESGEILRQEEVGGHVHDVSFDSEQNAFFVAAHERVEFWKRA